MAYVSSGQIVETRSPWRLSIIPDIFWGIISFITLFFHSLIQPGSTRKGQSHSTDYRTPGDPRGPPPPGPRRRMGGFRGGGGGPAPPPMAGGG